jgi:hypothetical protein
MEAKEAPRHGPNWLIVSSMSYLVYDVEINISARPGSTEDTLYRHRPRAYSGEVVAPWAAGLPNIQT